MLLKTRALRHRAFKEIINMHALSNKPDSLNHIIMKYDDNSVSEIGIRKRLDLHLHSIRHLVENTKKALENYYKHN